MRGFAPIHATPEEIEVLDLLEGKEEPEKDRVYNMKVYRNAGGLISHPTIFQAGLDAMNNPMDQIGNMYGKVNQSIQGITNSAQDLMQKQLPQGFNTGGSVAQHAVADAGRRGDTKLVWVPEKIIPILDHALGHSDNINPDTGNKEYAGLGSFFKGIGQKFRPTRFGTSMSKGLRDIGSNIFGTIGNTAKNFLGGIGDTAKQVLGGTPEGGWGNALGKAALKGAVGAGQAYLGGADPRTALASGAINASQDFNTPGADMFRSGVGSYMSGESPRNAMLNATQAAASRFDTPMGRAVNRGAGAYRRGASPGRAALEGVSGGLEGNPNPFAQGAVSGLGSYLGGESAPRATLNAVSTTAGGFGNNPVAAGIRGAADSRLAGENFPKNIVRGGLSAYRNQMGLR